MTDIIPTFNTQSKIISAVGSTETNGWWVIGTLQAPINYSYSLDTVGQISVDGIVMTIKIIDCTAGMLLSPVVTIVQTIPKRAQSIASINLIKGNVYQILAKVVSTTPVPNANEFGVISVATFKR